LGKCVKFEEIFRKLDCHFGTARETCADLIEFRTDGDQAWQRCIRDLGWSFIAFKSRDNTVDLLLSWMLNSPHPFADIDLLVEANAHVIGVLPRDVTFCAQSTSHKLGL
jgi:hypothetical protein